MSRCARSLALDWDYIEEDCKEMQSAACHDKDVPDGVMVGQATPDIKSASQRVTQATRQEQHQTPGCN